MFFEKGDGLWVDILFPCHLYALKQAFDLGFVLVSFEITLERGTGIGKQDLGDKAHGTGRPFDIEQDVRNGHSLFGQDRLKQ